MLGYKIYECQGESFLAAIYAVMYDRHDDSRRYYERNIEQESTADVNKQLVANNSWRVSESTKNFGEYPVVPAAHRQTDR